MSIQVSPKHGINPSMSVCFLCGEDDGTIVLPGRLRGDIEAPRRGVWSMEPCDKCKDYQKQGIILISVDEAKSTDMKNPYRTGAWLVIKEDAVRRMFDEASVESIVKARVAFVEDETWDALGLPRDPSDVQ